VNFYLFEVVMFICGNQLRWLHGICDQLLSIVCI